MKKNENANRVFTSFRQKAPFQENQVFNKNTQCAVQFPFYVSLHNNGFVNSSTAKLSV